MRRIVIVGGSIAAVTAASTLRAHGWDGELTVVSAEDDSPYSRVPLSKGVLAGAQHPGSAALPALPDDIALWQGVTADGLDVTGRTVHLADGRNLAFDGLVVATGSRARRLARSGQRGELVLRTLDDVRAITARLARAETAVVVGSGFLAMEVASTLVAHGIRVSLVARQTPQRRQLGGWLAGLLARRASAHGVDVIVDPAGAALVGDPVRGVTVGGVALDADLVISAAGDLPNVEWLSPSTLATSDGLLVDAHCRTEAFWITGAGDVTARRAAGGRPIRMPHWTNAVAQARTAALSLLDAGAQPYEEQLYYWTEQFGIEVKIAGRIPGDARPVVLEGDPERGSALVSWREKAGPVAVAAIDHRISVAKLRAHIAR